MLSSDTYIYRVFSKTLQGNVLETAQSIQQDQFKNSSFLILYLEQTIKPLENCLLLTHRDLL